MINCSSWVQNTHTCVRDNFWQLIGRNMFPSFEHHVRNLRRTRYICECTRWDIFTFESQNETEISNLNRIRKCTWSHPCTRLRIPRDAVRCNCRARSAPLGETRKMLPIRRKRALTPLRSKCAPVGPANARRSLSAADSASDAEPRGRSRLKMAWLETMKYFYPFAEPFPAAKRRRRCPLPTRRKILLRRETACIVPGIKRTRRSSRSDRWNFDDGIKRRIFDVCWRG